jgi:hypothetical protein
MYDPMRFAFVDDPFGVRVDFYWPIEGEDKIVNYLSPENGSELS